MKVLLGIVAFVFVICCIAFPIYFGDLVLGLVIIGFLAVISCLLVDKICYMLRPGKHQPRWVLNLWAFGFLWLVVSHIYGCTVTMPLKGKFAEVAVNSSPSSYTVAGDWDRESYTKLDYGGALDRIVAQRKAMLARRGTIYFGSWNSGDQYPTSGGLYIIVNPIELIF